MCGDVPVVQVGRQSARDLTFGLIPVLRIFRQTISEELPQRRLRRIGPALRLRRTHRMIDGESAQCVRVPAEGAFRGHRPPSADSCRKPLESRELQPRQRHLLREIAEVTADLVLEGPPEHVGAGEDAVCRAQREEPVAVHRLRKHG